METFFFVNFYKNNIITDLADFVPWNNIFIVSPEKAAQFPGTGDNKCCESTGFAVEFNIDRAAQTTAGGSIDDFFLFQFTDAHKKSCNLIVLLNLCIFWNIYASPFIDTVK